MEIEDFVMKMSMLIFKYLFSTKHKMDLSRMENLFNEFSSIYKNIVHFSILCHTVIIIEKVEMNTNNFYLKQNSRLNQFYFIFG